MLASEARLLLRFLDTPTQNARYLVWRSDITGYMGQNGIISQSQAGTEKWDTLKMYAISHQFARGYKGSYLKGRNSVALQEALQTLLMDLRLSSRRGGSSPLSQMLYVGVELAGNLRMRMMLRREKERE